MCMCICMYFLCFFSFCQVILWGFFGFFKKAVGKRDMELEGWEGGMALGENKGMESQYCTKNFNKNNLNYFKYISP